MKNNFINKWVLCMAIIIALILIGACTVPSESIAKLELNATENQPNVVFILVDDMGFGDVGFNGSEIATPNLDGMAKAGVRLDRNYVYPICSPTRAALLTGRNPLEFGVDGPMASEHGLPLDLKILPEYFKDLGYQTSMVGKWHLGNNTREHWPISRGFEYHYGFLGGWVDFYTHVYEGGYDWQRDGKTVREDGYATELFTDDAVNVIQTRVKEKPLFLYLTYNAPHWPLQHTPSNSGLNDDVAAGDRSVYAEMVTNADAAIGEVIAALRDEGILDNTLIVFSSDNGGDLKQGASNGSLKGAKGGVFEGGMRVPGLVWWPGKVEGGRVLAQTIVVHDWLPTLLSAVGADPAAVDNAYGQDMWAAILEGAMVERKMTTIGVNNAYSVLDWPWKLVKHSGNRAAEAGENLQLYNIDIDPNETTELSALHPEVFTRLRSRHEAMPRLPSKRSMQPPPLSLFRTADDSGWNYDLRLSETREPWAEAVP